MEALNLCLMHGDYFLHRSIFLKIQGDYFHCRSVFFLNSRLFNVVLAKHLSLPTYFLTTQKKRNKLKLFNVRNILKAWQQENRQ